MPESERRAGSIEVLDGYGVNDLSAYTDKSFVYQRIAADLRRRIADGQYAPGERLPSNDRLSGEMSVNRLTIRRALSSLVKEGLLVTQPSRGTFVTPTPPRGRAATPPVASSAVSPVAPASSPAGARPLKQVGLFSEVFWPDFPGAYHMEFLHAVRKELSDIGCSLIIPPKASRVGDGHAWEYAADGVVLLGPFARVPEAALYADRPAVLVDDYRPELPVDSVAVDNVEAGRLAAAHLAERGHRRAAVVTGDMAQPSAQDRLRGFRTAWGADVPAVNGEFQRHVAHARVRELLDAVPDVTALFCMNDDMAAGALDALHELGRDGLAVVGCDDVGFASMIRPALTSVRIPRHTMARLAARCLRGWAAARADRLPPVRHTVAPELVVRRSTPEYRA